MITLYFAAVMKFLASVSTSAITAQPSIDQQTASAAPVAQSGKVYLESDVEVNLDKKDAVA